MLVNFKAKILNFGLQVYKNKDVDEKTVFKVALEDSSPNSYDISPNFPLTVDLWNRLGLNETKNWVKYRNQDCDFIADVSSGIYGTQFTIKEIKSGQDTETKPTKVQAKAVL
jgi:hypothetical protein